MKRINGTLVAQPSDPQQPDLQPSDTITPSFMGYRVQLLFDVDITSQTDPDRTYRISQSRDVIAEPNGSFVIEFEEELEIADGVARILVSAPNGARLHDQTYTQNSLNISIAAEGSPDASTPVTITVQPTTISLDPRSPQPNNLTRGKIIQYCGQSLAENTDIIFWGCGNVDDPNAPIRDLEANDETSQHPMSDESCQILATAKSRADGTFAVQTPNGTYASAWVQWGTRADQCAKIKLTDEGAWPLAITLVESINFKGEDGDKAHDCSCSGSQITRLPSASDLAEDLGTYSSDLDVGNCQVHFKPNRTLEEFAFCSFVRTTEPTIAREEISVADLSDLQGEMRDFTRNFTLMMDRMKNLPDLFFVSTAPNSDADSPTPTEG